MTEKRFFILKDEEYDDVLPCIRDRQRELEDIYGHYKYDDINQICDKLNALHEENEQLQSEVSKLTDLLASEIEKNGRLLQENNSLKIENMRLKELKE